jgi:hypothetical protein
MAKQRERKIDDEDWLRSQYIEKGLTQKEIAKKTTFSKGTIHLKINSYSINDEENYVECVVCGDSFTRDRNDKSCCSEDCLREFSYASLVEKTKHPNWFNPKDHFNDNNTYIYVLYGEAVSKEITGNWYYVGKSSDIVRRLGMHITHDLHHVLDGNIDIKVNEIKEIKPVEKISAPDLLSKEQVVAYRIASRNQTDKILGGR